jgi:hypothetical protein
MEAVRIVQSHMLMGQSPTYGTVRHQLVEYGIARLREEHKGEIVEPLAFLSVMKWLEKEHKLNLQANLRRLGNQSSRGSALEEVAFLYLLRALRHPVPFTTVFDFKPECTPPWADEKAHIVARRDKKDVPVDVLGGAPENPGLSVAHYASDIEDIIGWIDELDTASVLLIPSQLFGPDVMVRCRSSPSNRDVLLMGQLKSYTVGNNASVDAKMVAGALASLHPDHWFKQAVCYLGSLLSSSHEQSCGSR